jgi:crossover junction endodeoxyribonuclease RusA
MNYEFEMPWPPRVNARTNPFRNRMILSKRGREYRVDALAALKELGIDKELVSSRLSVSLVLNPPTLRKYDIDNFCKSLFDALTVGEFWIDDEQVDRLIVTKGVKTKGGNIQIKVEVIQ